MGEHKAAKEIYDEIFKFFKDLPQTLESDEAATLNNFGNLMGLMGETDKAEDAFNKAVELKRSLVTSNPKYYPSLAMSLCNLALLRAKNGSTEVEKSYIEAIEIIREVANNNPYAYLPELAQVAANMSLFYLKSKPDAGKSIALALEAIRCITPFIGKLQTADEVMRIAMNVLQKNGFDGLIF